MLRLEGVTKRFGTTSAVEGLDLDVGAGEFVSLLGPSGCGKTTTLRLIAGFETPTHGRVLVQGQDVTQRAPHRRGIGMVFQNYALFPHLNVMDNVAFGLREQRVAREEIGPRVRRALERVDLVGYDQRKVQQLSGGQQQRVALARALAPEPRLVLLDEPLSNLDAALRERTRRELRALLKDVGITAVFVTHDQEEAFALSDRIALLERGHLQQFGSPEELYVSPANAFVASFVGRGNELRARVLEANGAAATVQLAGGARWVVRPIGASNTLSVGQHVRVIARPEALTLEPGQSTDPLITERRFAGGFVVYTVRLGDDEVLVHGPHDRQIGERVQVSPRRPDTVFAVVAD
ncbi:MAG: ABC transporter ATP-binding protein [Longimicrobiales bacterium]